MKKIFQILFIAIIISIVGLLGFMSKSKAQAPAIPELYGYAWSSNVGWISFNNCDYTDINHKVCYGNVSYSVAMANNGKLSGAAWSPNVGSIIFDPSYLGPLGTGPSAAIDSSGNLTGWARAAAAFPSKAGATFNGDKETVSSTDNTASEWADGWIKFSGTTANSGTYSTAFNAADNSASGFAWGGEVFGWVSMKGSNFGVKITGATFVPTATLMLDHSNISVGQSAVLTWTSTNATYCTKSTNSNISSWDTNSSTAATELSGISTGAINTAGTYTFSITCTGSGGTSAPSVKTLIVSPMNSCTASENLCTSISSSAYNTCITCTGTQTYNTANCVCTGGVIPPGPGVGTTNKIPKYKEN